jgi:hypothetical protein
MSRCDDAVTRCVGAMPTMMLPLDPASGAAAWGKLQGMVIDVVKAPSMSKRSL